MDGLVVGALGFITVATVIGYWAMTRAQRALGELRFEVTPGPFGLGDVVACRLLKPGTDTGVALSEQAAGGELRPGVPLTTTFRFVVPPAGPVSCRGRWIAIEWRLRVTLDLARREDPSHVQTLTGVPA